MMRYQNGRFFTHGICFAIPDGFHLETEPDYVYEYGLGAWTPDQSCYVEWNIEENCLGTEKELSALFQEASGSVPLTEIRPVSVNGLSGHQMAYREEQKYFLEVRLALKEKAELVFLVSGEGEDILSRMDLPDLQQALNSIRPE